MKRLLAMRLPPWGGFAAPTPPSWSHVRWNLRRWFSVRQWGRLGVVAVGLLMMCLPFYFSAIRPAQERLESARSSALQLGQQLAQGRRGIQGGQGAPAEQLEQYYRKFPAEKDSPSWLGKLIASAAARGIVLEQGEYNVSRDKVGRLVRFQMTLPVKGEYPRIRQFLSALPSEVPVVAVEHVQFERQKVGEAAVQAKLKLVLFLEGAP